VAIRRQKLDREVNLLHRNDAIIEVAPGWAFSITCPHYGEIAFDFTSYRRNGRDELAAQMRDALWNLRHEMVGISLRGRETLLSYFWRFLDELHQNGEPITDLFQIDRTLIDRFLAWLELQKNAMGKKKGEPFSLSTKKAAYGTIKALLVNRQIRCPEAVSADLKFPKNPFPNLALRTPKRLPYSAEEQRRIDSALNKDLQSIYESDGSSLPHLQVLAVHLLVLARTTGRNMQSLLELRRGSLQDHPLPDMDLLVTYKRRGGSVHASSHRKLAVDEHRQVRGIPAHIGGYFRGLCEITAPLAGEATGEDADFVLLRRISQGPLKGQVQRYAYEDARSSVVLFGKRHNLLDDSGKDLVLNVARLRPTFGHELYRRTRDIRCVQQALGHSNAQTTARYYAGSPLEAERDHAVVLDAMVSHYTRMEVNGKVLLAADGELPLQNVPDLLSSGYSTGIARCRNPFREDGGVCQKFFPCFTCPSMIVFEDDLWRLLSFYCRLLQERAKLPPLQWLKTYGPIIRRIDVDIIPHFPSEKVEEARSRAQRDPHPTWKGPVL